MGRTVAEKIAELPADRQERIHARAEELTAEVLTLQQLRKAWHKTQAANFCRPLVVKRDHR